MSIKDGLTQEKLSDALELRQREMNEEFQGNSKLDGFLEHSVSPQPSGPMCYTHSDECFLPSLVCPFPGHFHMAKVQPSSFLLSGDRSYLQESLL